MNLGILRWLCLIFVVGLGAAADLPFVFNDTSTGVANYTADQLTNISASSPELVGVPSISTPSDNEVLTFPGNNTPGSKTYCRTVGDLKKTFNVMSWREKGIILFNLARYDESLQAFNQAIKLSPQDADNWNSKGAVLAQLGRYNQAIKCFDLAARLDPSFIIPWLNKAKALSDLGKYQEAIRACDKAIGLNTKYGRSWNSKGEILKTEADAAFAKAIELGYKG